MSLSTVTQFRGLSGDIVSRFVSPGIWFTLMPVYGIWLLVILLSYVLTPSAEISFFVSYAIAAFLVGRYALPAAQGDLHSGFFSEHAEIAENVQFTLRALAFTFVWELPLYGLMQLIGTNISAGALTSPAALLGTGFVTIVGVLLLLLVVIGPLMSFIMATATSSFSAVFTALPYKWLYSRLSDIPVIIASALGGWFVFFFLYLAPVLLICSGIASQSFQGAIIAGFLVFLIPSASMPVLIGRLCGAFVYGNERLEKGLSAEMFSANEPAIEPEDEEMSESGEDTSPCPQFEPLPVDPSQEIIDWTKESLPALSHVEYAYVYLRSFDEKKQQICIGITTTEGLRLGDISQLKKDLAGLSCPFAYELLTADTMPEVQKHGMMIYKRKIQ